MPPLFVLERVEVRHGAAVLLDKVSAEIAAQACTAVVGPSGAGKSTLLRLLNRLSEATSGVVRFRGAPVGDLDVLSLRRRVGLVAQTPVLLTDTVIGDLRVGQPSVDTEQARDLLGRVGLPAAMLDRGTGGLSVGEAQRVCLARALAVGPEALLLDEPTSALDPASAAAVEAVVKDLVASGMAAVLVSHNAAQARRTADQVLVLRAGRLVERGAPEEIAYLKENGG